MCKQVFIEVTRTHGPKMRVNVNSINTFDDVSITIDSVRYNLSEESMKDIKEILL